jgi:hypothetical protein
MRFAGNSSEELNLCKSYVFGVEEVKGDEIGMGDTEPADKSAVPY